MNKGRKSIAEKEKDKNLPLDKKETPPLGGADPYISDCRLIISLN